MPFSGTTYTLPSGYQAVSGEAISSSTYNGTVEDLQTALNTVVHPSDSITLSGNLTLSGNNTFTGTNTFNDDGFTLQDNVDDTKKLRFQLSGLTTSTIRTLTVPDVDDTLMVLGADQTVTGAIIFAGQNTTFSKAATPLDAEGGQLFLEKATNSTLPGNVQIDNFVNQVRFTTIGKGAFIDFDSLIGFGEIWHQENIGARINALTALTSATINPNGDRFIIRDATDGLPKTVVLNNIRRGAPDAVLENQRPNGSNDGSPASTGVWSLRQLNTKVKDPFLLITLSANQFTPSEFGWVRFTVLGSRVGTADQRAQSRLFNVTTAAGVSFSTPGLINSNNSTTTTNFVMEGAGPVTGGNTYRIETIVSNNAGTGAFGRAASQGGTEIYVRVEYWRD